MSLSYDDHGILRLSYQVGQKSKGIKKVLNF